MENCEEILCEKLAWTPKEEDYLVELMVREVRGGSLSTSTFSKRTWSSISAKMQERFKQIYSITKLKQKYNRLRAKWKLFKELVDSTGFGWDPNKNTVDATEEEWAKKIAANKEYKQFRKKGCEHYDLLTEIFNETVATGLLARSSTQGPLNSDEEQEVEEVFLHGSSVNNPNPFTDDEISEIDPFDTFVKNKKKRGKGATGGGKGLKGQCVEPSKADLAWDAIREAQEIKKSIYLRADVCKEEECVDILESIEGVTTEQYMRAISEFKDSSLRIMFVRMSVSRRLEWVRKLA